MALPKPQASKAPAYVMDQNIFVNTSVNDPCCIPSSVVSNPLMSNSSPGGDMGHMANGDTLGHIKEPTRH